MMDRNRRNAEKADAPAALPKQYAFLIVVF
jgi:hypothetical protein